MTISYFLPLSIVLLFRLDVDDSVLNRSTNCCVSSFFLYYYTFERGSLEFFSCFSIRYFSIYYIFPYQFRRFDASSFESSFDIYICYIEGICLFDYIYQQRGFSFVFFFLKENCSNFKLEGMLKPSHTISTLVPDK